MDRRAFLRTTGLVAGLASVGTVPGSAGQQSGPPSAAWTETFTLGGTETANTTVPGVDGGFVFAGQTTVDGVRDGWAMKVDEGGGEVWRRSYGGDAEGWISAATPTADGYLLAGQTASLGNGQLDAWLLKIDADGAKQWERPYGDTRDDRASSVITDGSDFVFAGGTNSEGSGGIDAWVMRVDGTGDERWNKVYGGPGDDWAFSHVGTDDGGYLLAGETDSAGSGGRDAWLLKTDSDGDAQWNKVYGGSADDYARDVVTAQDGGYVFVGGTQSAGSGGTDGWIVKVSADGTQQWETRVGGGSDDRLVSLCRRDGGYLAVGSTASSGRGQQSTWAVQFDADGTELWADTYGTDDLDYANAVTGSDPPLIAGTTESAGDSDARLVQLGTRAAPSAAFVVTPSQPETELATTFDGGGSTTPNGSIRAYSWDVDGDDRFERSGESVTHRFDQVGTVPVTLRIESTDGTADTVTRSLDVSVARSGALRQAAANVDGVTVASMDHGATVESAVTRLNQRVREGRVPLETAEEATERLLLAERFTESVVGGLGPDTYDRSSAEYDLAGHTTELALTVLVNITMAALSLAGGKIGKYVGKKLPLVSSYVDDLVTKLDDAVAKLADYVANLSGAAGQALKNRADSIAEDALETLGQKAGERGATDVVGGFIDEQVAAVKSTVADSLRQVVEWDGDPFRRGSVAHLDDGLGLVYTDLDPDRIERDGLAGSQSGARSALSAGVSRVDDELRVAHAGLQAIQDTLDNFGLVDNLVDAVTAIAEGDATQAVLEVLWAIGSLVGDIVSMVFNIVGAGYGVKTMLDVASVHEETLTGIAEGRAQHQS
ncbi:PKD domain-containing protein [Haloarcula onubensis]|uniref:PKD domain-containing protein n=1 Tax=Haloarcula onubensis TaxID=2950539 RepID=A0ABU2FR09_9EURY|nr:PKD domain-containing protein [Halomicroarcula sp. S3CR25-11]MDS0283197.1 PKD domain-containing protein [Halomicroarcula sp. S3CR25-11]